MGSVIEINDTLKLTQHEGLPAEPKMGVAYAFCKSERRLYHLQPTRVFLVEEKDGLWNFIGHAEITKLSIDAVANQTSGEFVITQIYDKAYAAQLNKYEAPKGKGQP